MAGPIDKSSIIEFFLVEAGEHLQNLNKGLLALERDADDREVIDELFRAAHTLKGSAAMMGFPGISDVAHKAEDMLGQFRSGSVPIRKDTLNFLFDGVDAIKLMVDSVAAQQPEDPLVVESIAASYSDIIKSLGAGEAPPQSVSPDIEAESEAPRKQPAGADIPSPAAPPSERGEKDDLDLAWEKTFDISEQEPIAVEPIVDDEQTAVAESEAAPPPESAAAPIAAVDTAPPAGAVKPDASLREELEEAKKAGVIEKRGVGRRAADAVDVEKQFIRVSIERLDNLMNLVGEMIVNRNRLVKQVELIKSLREELSFSQKRLLAVVKGFEEKYEYTLDVGSPQLPGALASEPSLDFMDLEFDRYDDFNLLSRKLTEITNDTNEIMTELAEFFDTFELDTSRISTITSNLQDEITMARMVEMDRLFQLFQRPVRDIAQAEGKRVNMVVTGADTKIDKTIFEIISDPVMHMVRNAISHGIEPPAERSRMGKDATGVLILNARHEGNNIVLDIEDDGRGIDTGLLRKVAVEKGFLTQAEAAALTDAEAINLIFKAGFSTATAVGKVSGRGVGMDVVSNQLAKINGRIEIKTEKGVGTKFVIKLPLTLAIAQALIIKVKEQELAIPMTLVEETTRFSYKDVQRAAGEEMVNLRGSLIHLLKLNDILGVGKFPRRDESFRHPTLILGMAEKRLALMVEDILGREEIVVKSLGEYLRSVKMFSGATISGEGDVRMILNVGLLFGDEALSAKTSVISVRDAITADAAARRKPTVLIVDDSISIRKFVQRFLDRSGFEVDVATDGMDALNVLGRAKFDVVITDLEMPIMHGYDLMSEMKRNPALMQIPIIVLTSRAGEKHRQKAIDMGAQDYLVKPFDEQEMLGALKRLLSGAVVAGRA